MSNLLRPSTPSTMVRALDRRLQNVPGVDLVLNESQCFLRFLDELDFAAGVVDRDRTFLFVNRAMRGAMEASGHASPGSAFLRAVDTVVTEGRPFCGVVEVCGSPWSLRLWPFDGERVAFYGRETARVERPITRVAERLGLSPAEARLALHVTQGKSNSAIARLLGVKLGALKTRLWKIFRQVGVRNRTELATRILQCLAPDGEAPTAGPFHPLAALIPTSARLELALPARSATRLS